MGEDRGKHAQEDDGDDEESEESTKERTRHRINNDPEAVKRRKANLAKEEAKRKVAMLKHVKSTLEQKKREGKKTKKSQIRRRRRPGKQVPRRGASGLSVGSDVSVCSFFLFVCLPI